MSAEDNLSRQMFHGTDEVLKPGDLVRPMKGKGSNSFATDSLDEAQAYAGYASKRWKPGGSPSMFGIVYEVEPTDVPTVHKTGIRMADNDATVFSSTKGFKVKKQAGWSV